jgi:hypothetical protein
VRFARVLSPLALIVLIACATWELVSGRIVARGDLLLYFYPLRDFAAEAVRTGRIPLWNPYTFLGAPFLANSQVGFFYPFNLLTAWLPVERAVSLQIVLHLMLAAAGGYALGRRLALARDAAFALGVMFGLGGYLGAQIEHLNQLQVLAWLPWLLALLCGATHGRREIVARTALCTAIFALQLLAGHTQSLYIAGITAGLTGIVLALARTQTRRDTPRNLMVALLPLALAAALAGAIAAAQLLPTLELSRESFRSGGLSFGETGAFSWRPWVAARALLPTYGDPLFPEYIAYIGAAGLALTGLGALTGRTTHRQAWLLGLVLTVVGVVLAFGIATPVFNVLYRVLPGFNLFRAQARWLVMAALGASIWVALGVAALRAGLARHTARRWLLVWFAIVAAVGGGLVLGARISPEPEYASLPARNVLLGWGVATTLTTGLVLVAQRVRSARFGLVGLGLLVTELMIASQFQPYARTTDAQALTSLRPAVAHLQSAIAAGNSGRVLALSGLFFDPGDKPEQELVFRDSLHPDEIYDRLIASKHKEILSPNLPLYFRLPSVDGYDGGLLPTRQYIDYTAQFAGDAARDGRLREFLQRVPEPRWLDAMSVRYVIADKTQDVFIDGVFYDLLFSTPLDTPSVFSLEPYSSTALGLVFGLSPTVAGAHVANALIRFDDATTQSWPVRVPAASPPDGFHAVLSWDTRRTPLELTLTPVERVTGLVARGVTLIDGQDSTFKSQIASAGQLIRLVHSGDVKIYERVGATPRATLSGSPLAVRISEETPERIRLTLAQPTAAASTLVMRDACGPGWTALVDGVPAEVRCEDTVFRAIDMPAGAREVLLTYAPGSFRNGALLSVAGLLLWLVLLCYAAVPLRLRKVFNAGTWVSRAPRS